MSHGILIDLDPNIFAILVSIGMVVTGLLLEVVGGRVAGLAGRFLIRKGRAK